MQLHPSHFSSPSSETASLPHLHRNSVFLQGYEQPGIAATSVDRAIPASMWSHYSLSEWRPSERSSLRRLLNSQCQHQQNLQIYLVNASPSSLVSCLAHSPILAWYHLTAHRRMLSLKNPHPEERWASLHSCTFYTFSFFVTLFNYSSISSPRSCTSKHTVNSPSDVNHQYPAPNRR